MPSTTLLSSANSNRACVVDVLDQRAYRRRCSGVVGLYDMQEIQGPQAKYTTR